MNLINLDDIRTIKDTKQFAEAAIRTLMEAQSYITQLEEKVQHLEGLLVNSPVPNIQGQTGDSELDRKPHQIEIIEVEFKRLHDICIANNTPLTGDNLKKFDVLVKCFATLKGTSTKKPSKQEEKESIGDLLKLVSSNDQSE